MRGNLIAIAQMMFVVWVIVGINLSMYMIIFTHKGTIYAVTALALSSYIIGNILVLINKALNKKETVK